MSDPSFDCPRRIESTMAPWSPSWTGEKHADYIDMALDPEGHPVYTESGEVIAPQDHWRSDGTCSYCGSMSPESFFGAIERGAEIGPTDKNYKVYLDGVDDLPLSGRGKFYTVHLNRHDAARLRGLLVEGTVKIGYPGYFYRGLFLAAPKPAEEQSA